MRILHTHYSQTLKRQTRVTNTSDQSFPFRQLSLGRRNLDDRIRSLIFGAGVSFDSLPRRRKGLKYPGIRDLYGDLLFHKKPHPKQRSFVEILLPFKSVPQGSVPVGQLNPRDTRETIARTTQQSILHTLQARLHVHPPSHLNIFPLVPLQRTLPRLRKYVRKGAKRDHRDHTYDDPLPHTLTIGTKQPT
jgi:hypothetical protein